KHHGQQVLVQRNRRPTSHVGDLACGRVTLARVTLAFTISIFWSAATLASAFPSWLRPRAALNRVSRIRRTPVASWPGRHRRTPPATTSTFRRGSRSGRGNARHFGPTLPAVSLFGPLRASLAAASASVSPSEGSTPCASSACAALSECQAGVVAGDPRSGRLAGPSLPVAGGPRPPTLRAGAGPLRELQPAAAGA